jgi:hypothetical protein
MYISRERSPGHDDILMSQVQRILTKHSIPPDRTGSRIVVGFPNACIVSYEDIPTTGNQKDTGITLPVIQNKLLQALKH